MFAILSGKNDDDILIRFQVLTHTKITAVRKERRGQVGFCLSGRWNRVVAASKLITHVVHAFTQTPPSKRASIILSPTKLEHYMFYRDASIFIESLIPTAPLLTAQEIDALLVSCDYYEP